MTIQSKVSNSITQRGPVFLRRELNSLGSIAQVGKVLAQMVKEGRLIRVSKGVFVQTRRNKFSGLMTPIVPFEVIAQMTFEKLGIEVQLSRQVAEYNRGETTQIPLSGVVSTGKARVRRRIQLGNKVVKYENARGTISG